MLVHELGLLCIKPGLVVCDFAEANELPAFRVRGRDQCRFLRHRHHPFFGNARVPPCAEFRFFGPIPTFRKENLYHFLVKMSRFCQNPHMTHPSGFLLIDKPAGPTSHDIVDRVRRITSERTVGHAGTLDPFATGLLIVGVGREATKHLSLFLGLDKTYEATFVFGASSDTDDKTGAILQVKITKPITPEEIKIGLKGLIGPIGQIPPTYAAIKIKGQKMYEAARAGKPLAAPPRAVTIHKFELIGKIASRLPVPERSDGGQASPTAPRNDEAYFRIHCSSGTYIRALARDLGKALGTAAYVSELRRTAIGPIRVSEAVSLNNLNQKTIEQFLISTESLLSRLP